MSESFPFSPDVDEEEPSPSRRGRVRLPLISSFVETWSDSASDRSGRGGRHILSYKSTLLRRVSIKATTVLDDATYIRVPSGDSIVRGGQTWIHQGTISTGDKRLKSIPADFDAAINAAPSVVVQFEASCDAPYGRVRVARRRFPLS